MNEILEQLELNQTIFIQLAIFGVVFLILSRLYFRPFMKLFQARHEKTVQHRETAEKLLLEANQKFESYRKRLSEERVAAKKEYDAVLEEAKKYEAQAMANAREEAKKITQEAADSVSKQREALRAKLAADVDVLAETISQKLLPKKS
ncbi:MAG: ATP synthase F0 subunit B [Oligoflexia bacterium]|nr:ATP synthase F0 subunit B [Oligoflexia bacterium]